MESEIIIFDEPTAALDPLNAAMLEEVLGKMSEEGRTMLISTHDVDFAYRWADRAVVFSNGQIIADDTPLNIFKQEDILEQASLKHPTMFDIYQIMEEIVYILIIFYIVNQAQLKDFVKWDAIY